MEIVQKMNDAEALRMKQLGGPAETCRLISTLHGKPWQGQAKS